MYVHVPISPYVAAFTPDWHCRICLPGTRADRDPGIPAYTRGVWVLGCTKEYLAHDKGAIKLSLKLFHTPTFPCMHDARTRSFDVGSKLYRIYVLRHTDCIIPTHYTAQSDTPAYVHMYTYLFSTTSANSNYSRLKKLNSHFSVLSRTMTPCRAFCIPVA